MNWLSVLKKPTRFKEDVFFCQLRQVLGFRPKNIALYHQAFSHSSCVRNKDGEHSERMEFLGDAILDAVVSDYLYHRYLEKDEGFLTQNRSKIVSRKSLGRFAEALNLEPMIRQDLDQSQRSQHLPGNIMEALIGAIYLDQGYEVVDRFIRTQMIGQFVNEGKLHQEVLSYRSMMHEWAQKTQADLVFQTEETSGPGHDRTYMSVLQINGSVVSRGTGPNKKSAREQAARRAAEKLHIQS